MKRIVLLILCLWAWAPDTFAQVFTQHIASQYQCQKMLYQYNISKRDTGLSVKTFLGDGNDTTLYLTDTQDHAYFTYDYAAAGVYTITSVLYRSGIPADTVTDNLDAYCEFVVLTSYIDQNSNCTPDYSEGLTRDTTQVEVDSAGTIIDTVSFKGAVEYKTTPGTTYKFRHISAPLGTIFACPSSGIITITTPVSGFAGFVPFGYTCNNTTLYDLGVEMTNRFRPVNTSQIFILATNNGCGVKNADVTLTLSSKYKYKSASPAPTSVSGQVITWNVNVSNSHSEPLVLWLDTAAVVNLGDTVCNSVTITPVIGDANPSDNTLSQCDPVVAAWDPNDKIVTPAGDIASGTRLTYTINFENLGGDTAFNIHILDTLSQHVDPASLEVISSSHTMMKRLVKNNIGKTIVKFDFPDIHLPDSNSKRYNKGFVSYSIRTKTGLPYYTPITNRAGIYFDINPVVLTNYAYNRIAAPAGIQDATGSDRLIVYPNPAADLLTIVDEHGNYRALKLVNNLGQTVIERETDGDRMVRIDMKQLQPGIYYIQAIGKNGTVHKKIEKL